MNHSRLGPRTAPVLRLLAAAAAGVLLITSGCAAWRVKQAMALAQVSEPWQQVGHAAPVRLLVVGDSTGVGTGASAATNSLAGLIGQAHPSWTIENRAEDGAQLADVVRQLHNAPSFDLVLVQAGGNDVIRMRSYSDMQKDIQAVTDLARQRGATVIWMPAGNVGNAPFFFAPVSWLMTARSREMHRLVQEAAARSGAVYVNLFHERSQDPFVTHPELNARDGLHPSDSGYQIWLRALKAHPRLSALI